MRKRTVGVAAAIAAICVSLLQSGALAAFDPYASGTNGYDYSYLQCKAAAPGGSFGIIGVTAGYPFTYYNNCLAREFSNAARAGDAALYVNTGYDPRFTAIDGRHTTRACADQSTAVAGTQAQKAAWAVGCSESERDLAYAAISAAGSATMWWLDVETVNSWSTSDLSLNRFTIQGAIDRLRSGTGAPVGVYSSGAQWQAVTGGFTPRVDADWLATRERTAKRAAGYCGRAGFTGARIWLVQYVPSYDRDYAC